MKSVVNKKTAVALGLSCVLYATASEVDNGCKKDKPNILLILVDDMGFSDIGCFGSPIIETPNLDKLAENGIRFSQFYNCARSSPSRAALLTGLYPHQSGVGHLETMNRGEEHPGYRGQLNKECITIAEGLQQVGYLTAISGKWHIGGKYGVCPWNRGFDRSLTGIDPAFYYPEASKAKSLHLNGEPISPTSEQLPKNWYSTDLYAEMGNRFINEAIEKNKPFFLYLAFNAPHFPLQAPVETIEKYEGKFSKGWDAMRIDIYKKQIELGIIKSDFPLSKKHPDVPDWSSLDKETNERMQNIQEVYAACVDRMDFAVGTVVKNLKEKGELDNTLIIFLSDNGANAESGIWGRYGNKVNAGTVTSTIFQGQSWATYSNTPFKRYKHFTHEGGISSPCIIHWPAGVPKKMNGTIIHHEYGNFIDVLPTCFDVANVQYPTKYKGNEILPAEGVSLVPILEDKGIKRAVPTYWEHEGNRAVRTGRWKLVALNHSDWELYDMINDRTEQHNVAEQHPDIVERLSEGWKVWAKRCHVEPWRKSK